MCICKLIAHLAGDIMCTNLSMRRRVSFVLVCLVAFSSLLLFCFVSFHNSVQRRGYSSVAQCLFGKHKICSVPNTIKEKDLPDLKQNNLNLVFPLLVGIFICSTVLFLEAYKTYGCLF